ncbi:MAG: YeeE/YedE thiosulfate transporter family protein [Methanomicrobiaceae archaeon]|nr:YeeE/YedE thiosulfate transporter family protein [Methanomicrobiaceae archaeon]
MFEQLHANREAQLALGLVMGIAFGFFLQTGGVTDYDIIIGQLLFTDFTVVKVMLSAVLVGMIGVYLMKGKGLVRLHARTGSVGSTVVGGLIFGAGFAVLGYCPGTVAGAVGQGALDALFGGALGILLGTGIYAAIYPALQRRILGVGTFPSETVPAMLRVNPWMVIVPLAVLILALFWVLESLGL